MGLMVTLLVAACLCGAGMSALAAPGGDLAWLLLTMSGVLVLCVLIGAAILARREARGP